MGIAFLHFTILASQALYMYLSNKDQMKKRRYMYLAALPIVLAVPIAMNMQNPAAYSLYEYSILFCFFTAAVADVCISTGFDKSYLTDENIQSLNCSYFMICAAVTYIENMSIAFKAVFSLILICVIAASFITKKNSVKGLLKAFPLTIFSIACAWGTCALVLGK